MPICPVCNAEYREEFKRCTSCEVDLVDRLPEADDEKFERLEKALEEQKAALSEPRTLEDAQRDAELLREARIHCLIWANEKMLGPTGVPLYYHLALLPEDVELARQTLKARREKMLAVEGLQTDAAIVDLAAERSPAQPAALSFRARRSVPTAASSWAPRPQSKRPFGRPAGSRSRRPPRSAPRMCPKPAERGSS